MPKLKTQKSKVKVIFMGTPEFGAIILEKLAQSEFKPISAITETDKPVGRKQILTPPPVKVMAEKYKIPVSQSETILSLKSKILNLKPHLIVVAAYGQILPKEILEIPKYGCLNVHPSLLPKYRGPSPIQYAILNGDRKTGVTIIKMTEKVDAGQIVSSIKYLVSRDETYETLHNKLVELGAKLLIKTIPDWIKGKIKPKPQDESKATFAKIIKKDDGKIDWQKSAKELERQIRAFGSWPGAFTFWQKNDKLLRIKILRARVLKTSDLTTYPIGKTLIAPQNELCLQTGKGFLVVGKLQLEGKKEMSSEEFLRGHPDFMGTILK